MACFSALIVGRLAPLGSSNTRFGPFRCPAARGPVRTLRVPASNPRSARPGPPPAPLAGLAVTGVPPRCTPDSRFPHAPDSRFPHDVRHPAAADPGRIPTLKRSLNSSTYATINAVPGRAVPRKSRRRRQYLVRPPQSPGGTRHHPAARVRPGLRRPVSLPCYAYL